MFTLWNLKHPPRTLSASLQFDLHILGLALSPPENGILFFLPLEMACYLWHLLVLMNNHLNISIIFGLYQRLVCPSCHWWWHLFLLTYDDTFYLNSMFAHSTLRSWRSLEILKVCPEKKDLKSCLWSVGISKKHQRSSIFSWLSSQKENWKKRTWIRCIFCWNTSELVFSQLSSRSVFMITPCAKISSLFDICLWYLCLILVLITPCAKRWVCLIFGIMQWCT